MMAAILNSAILDSSQTHSYLHKIGSSLIHAD